MLSSRAQKWIEKEHPLMQGLSACLNNPFSLPHNKDGMIYYVIELFIKQTRDHQSWDSRKHFTLPRPL